MIAQNAAAEASKGRMWWRLALLGLPGTFSVLLLRLDQFGPPPFDPALVKALAVAQPTVLMLLAVALGLWAAPKVGFDAPAVRAWAERRPILPALAPQLAPAAWAGAALALMLVGFWSVVRAQDFAGSVATFEMPLAMKLLYGGIVEELLLRWGVMSLFVWIAWRLGGAARPVPAWTVWTGLVASSMLFAAGHLPVLYFLIPEPPLWFVGLALAANFIPGMLFGWLYWRRGLEAAMIAHALAHLLSTAALVLL
jgi:hypothetical protein